MKKTLKILVSVAVIASMLSSVAFAAFEFAGYDTSNPGNYTKIYNEVIDGKYTSKQVSEPVKPEDVEWKFESYELAYPHTGYERLYLEGNAQNNITRLAPVYPQWETRFQDFMWELSGQHRIWERQQTKINNAYWAWDFGNDYLNVPDSKVFVPTGRNATVETTWETAGVLNLDAEGNFVYDQLGNVHNKLLYSNYDRFLTFGAKDKLVTAKDGSTYYTYTYEPNATDLDLFHVKEVINEKGEVVLTKEIVEGNFFHADNLSKRNLSDNQYTITDAEIAAKLDIPYLKVLTGPTYHGEPATKNVAVEYYKSGCNEAWVWDNDTTTIERYDALNLRIVPTISWTTPKYEMAAPYKYYQYLVVNGLVLDGRNDTPRVFRYTGGKADPKVEWRYSFMEADAPYQVVEVMFVENNEGEMILALDDNLNPYVRIPTGDFADSYIVVTDTEVQLWFTDGTHKAMVDAYSRVNGPFGGAYYGYTNAAGLIR